MHTVQGRCPSCHHQTLFLGEGGHVTCSLIGCTNPTAADDLLNGPTTTSTGEASERLKHAYQDVHGRLSTYVLADEAADLIDPEKP